MSLFSMWPSGNEITFRMSLNCPVIFHAFHNRPRVSVECFNLPISFRYVKLDSEPVLCC
jgi:hypothetical protein